MMLSECMYENLQSDEGRLQVNKKRILICGNGQVWPALGQNLHNVIPRN